MIHNEKDYEWLKSNEKFNTEEVKASFNNYYKKIFGKSIKIDRFDKNEKAQRSFGTDVVVTRPDTTRFSIDEKTRRIDYLGWKTYPFETWSNKELGHKGWFYTLQAGYISYGTVNTDGQNEKATEVLELLFFPLTKALRIWFENNIDDLRESIVSTNGLYHTHNRLVHIKYIKKYAGDEHFYQLDLNETDKIEKNKQLDLTKYF